MRLTVDGKDIEIDADPQMPLLWALRDIAQQGRQTMQAMLAETIEAEAASRGVDLDGELSAPVLAGIFFDAIDGLKEREFEPGALRSQARALALLMDRAIGG